MPLGCKVYTLGIQSLYVSLYVRLSVLRTVSTISYTYLMYGLSGIAVHGVYGTISIISDCLVLVGYGRCSSVGSSIRCYTGMIVTYSILSVLSLGTVGSGGYHSTYMTITLLSLLGYVGMSSLS